MQGALCLVLIFSLIESRECMTEKNLGKRESPLNFQNFWKERLTKRIDGSYLLTTYYVFPENPKHSNGIYEDICKSKFIPRDCSDIHKKWPEKKSGVYKVYPIGGEGHVVYCDMEKDGGGWTVIQRRINGKVDFYRPWIDYKKGFGAVIGEHWLGNEAIHEISAHGHYEIRFDLVDFDGTKAYAKYGTFRVENEANGYRLKTSGYSGNSGDAFSYQNGMKFTTKDRDNDKYSKNCASAEVYEGGWWFNSCQHSHMNGRYYPSHKVPAWRGLMWDTWRGKYYSLKSTQMMIRKHSDKR